MTTHNYEFVTAILFLSFILVCAIVEGDVYVPLDNGPTCSTYLSVLVS